MQTTIDTAKQIVDFFNGLKQNGTLQKIKQEVEEFLGTTSAYFTEQFAPFMPQGEPLKEEPTDTPRTCAPPMGRE